MWEMLIGGGGGGGGVKSHHMGQLTVDAVGSRASYYFGLAGAGEFEGYDEPVVMAQ